MRKQRRVLCLSLLWMTGGAMVGHTEENADQDEMNPETLPAAIRRMAQWPDASVLTGGNAVDPSDISVAKAKEQAWVWIRKVIDAPWQPLQDTNMVFIKKEFGDLDMARISWERNDYLVEVTQTASIFSMKLTPLSDAKPEYDPARQFDAAMRMCLVVFAREGRVWEPDDDGNPIAVIVPNLNTKINAVSFSRVKQELPTSSFVVKKNRNRATVVGSAKKGQGEQFSRSARLRQVSGLDGSDGTGSYWFQNVNWWHDGVSCGFYFEKSDGWVSPQPSPGDDADRNWFKP